MPYLKSTVFYSKPSGGPSACGCLGASYGEPLCPCGMAREGLPMSVSHVIVNEAAKARFASVDWFKKYES